MAATPMMEDAELIAFSTNPVVIKFDNNQLEVVYQPQYELTALAIANASIMNTVVSDNLGRIHFTVDQNNATLFKRATLRDWFNNLNLVSVSNDI